MLGWRLNLYISLAGSKHEIMEQVEEEIRIDLANCKSYIPLSSSTQKANRRRLRDYEAYLMCGTKCRR
jgi:hypothetical protein